MRKSIGRKLLRLAFFSDLHGMRFTLSLAEFIWGLTLLMPGDTFSRPTYLVMSRICSIEEVWGLVWLLMSLIQFYILITGEYHTRFAVGFAAVNSVFWWIVTISMYLSVTPIPAAISGEAALAVAAAFIFVRSGWLPLGIRRAPNADPH